MTSGASRFFDLAGFAATPLTRDPFPYLIVPGFLPRPALDVLAGDFPRIEKAGSFPVSELRFGPQFQAFLGELEGRALREAMAAKFEMDLSGRPTMVTVRGRAQAKDGRIHADSKTKLITVLIYMNERWEAPGGRLRLLRSPDSLEDCIVEVPPVEGTLIAFKVTPNSWHGHEKIEGERRVVQLNWVRDADVVRHEQNRHRFSAKIKRFFASAS
ncbi:MAG: 2OG-Fe(II) oxygenase [Alphaproteobacteria bacterium]|nr:2OG-Fe(II) oxygenase [Alphaproteobacteria bacterium]